MFCLDGTGRESKSLGKFLIVTLFLVGALMQFRDEIRAAAGLPPMSTVSSAAAESPSMSLQDVLASGRQPEVIMYATPTCPYCERARRYFDAQSIRYTEYNVNRSSSAARAMQGWGGRGVPTIVVAQSRVVKGWNPSNFERALLAAASEAAGQGN